MVLVLIPQLTYAFAFYRLNNTQMLKLQQIIVSPVRRALGLHRSASAIHTLWEAGIPDIFSLRLRAVLQSYNRAHRSSSYGNALPELLRNDMESFGPLQKSAFYCRPLAMEFHDLFDTLSPSTFTQLSSYF